MYQVIDIKTNQVVATKSTLIAASKLANRKDLAYGAIRYVVRFNQEAAK
jgi:hypothetical protein